MKNNMVVSILFQPTAMIDEELQLASAKSLSISSSSSSDADTNNNLIVPYDDENDDDHTIAYDNTTSHHHQIENTHQRQQAIFHLEEQRISQTSPSSVVLVDVPEVIVPHTPFDTTNTNTNSNSTSDITPTATTLSIPTLSNTAINTAACLSSTTVISTKTTTIVQKPFFIMDFLEDIDPHLLAQVQERLQIQPPSKQMSDRSTKATISPAGERDTPYSLNRNDSIPRCRIQPLSQHPSTSPTTIPTIITSRNNIASTMIDINSNNSTASAPDVAPPFLLQSIAISQQYHNRGCNAAQCGEWNRAIHYWEDSLDIQQQICHFQHQHPPSSHSMHQMADTYHQIGIAYGKLHQYEYALPYLHKALEIRIDTVAAIVAADDDDDENDTTTQSALTTTATTAQQQQQLHHDIASSLYAIGDIYQKQSQLSMALQFFIQCKLIQEALVLAGGIIRSPLEMARTCIAIGHTYAIGEAYSDAYEAYQDAMTIFHQWGIFSNGNIANTDDGHERDKNRDIDSNSIYYAEYEATLCNLQLMEQKK